MTIIGVVGDPAAVDQYLRSPRGARTAEAIADAIWRDEERLATYELGDGPELHPVVERELQHRITLRNARDDRADAREARLYGLEP